MKILSSAFEDGDEIPCLYTCDGNDISPPLTWEDLPKGTESLVLIVDDPDAPDPQAPKMTWVHWILYNLPASAAGLPEEGELPDLKNPEKEAVLAAMEGHVLARAELIGTFER